MKQNSEKPRFNSQHRQGIYLWAKTCTPPPRTT